MANIANQTAHKGTPPHIGRRRPIDANRTGLRQLGPAHKPPERRFAGTIVPDERNDLAALDAKRDAVKGAVDNGIYYLDHATPPSNIERAFHL